MFEITFLGTAASVPPATWNVSSLLVFHEAHRFLVDCGEGTQHPGISEGRARHRLTRGEAVTLEDG
jgi:ribonuclease Z